MEHTEEIREHMEAPKDMKKQIWKTFWILFVLTVLNIAIYLKFLGTDSPIKNYVFITLSFAKAYFIIGTFMHLKLERKSLRYLIILPVIFILYLLIIALTEGSSISFLKYIYK
ncbi:MAG: hypothetical protein A3F72_03775 [Bacteroidetes bacterium RIFCSPLOWO2_12_FULL_35_15]|nr:MAG: hypothetical protein A3F72_03775 [Bacteroidetes bacterium RIFCSPLOWO2_12_FULL_35_15]